VVEERRVSMGAFPLRLVPQISRARGLLASIN